MQINWRYVEIAFFEIIQNLLWDLLLGAARFIIRRSGADADNHQFYRPSNCNFLSKKSISVSIFYILPRRPSQMFLVFFNDLGSLGCD